MMHKKKYEDKIGIGKAKEVFSKENPIGDTKMVNGREAYKKKALKENAK